MILTINASPVANGTTEGFCETFEKCIKGKCRFERINLRDFNIPPSNGLYKIPTIEVRKIGERVLRSRGVFIATPTYWYNVPATLRAFIEQLTPIEEKLQKRSRLLAVATYSPEGGELGCFTAIVAPLNMLGFMLIGNGFAYRRNLKRAERWVTKEISWMAKEFAWKLKQR